MYVCMTFKKAEALDIGHLKFCGAGRWRFGCAASSNIQCGGSTVCNAEGGQDSQDMRQAPGQDNPGLSQDNLRLW